MTAGATVFVVDDDPAIRKCLERLGESVGMAVKTYGSAVDFLAEYDASHPGCLVVDLRLPGMSGLELQDRLMQQPLAPPIIFLTGYGDVAAAVSAVQKGALDFMEKPIRPQALLDGINHALARDAENRRMHEERAALTARFAHLTPREREVLERLAAGETAYQTARDLGVSVKTIYIHRSHIMEKLGVRSVAELTRLALTLRAGLDGFRALSESFLSTAPQT